MRGQISLTKHQAKNLRTLISVTGANVAVSGAKGNHYLYLLVSKTFHSLGLE